MSKTRVFALLMVAIILAAIITNPPHEKMEDVVKVKVTSILEHHLNYKDNDALQFGMTLFGDQIVEQAVKNNIEFKNYYLFSVVNLKWQSKKTMIGVGAFTKTWLSPKIDEKVEELVETLQKL